MAKKNFFDKLIDWIVKAAPTRKKKNFFGKLIDGVVEGATKIRQKATKLLK